MLQIEEGNGPKVSRYFWIRTRIKLLFIVFRDEKKYKYINIVDLHTNMSKLANMQWPWAKAISNNSFPFCSISVTLYGHQTLYPLLLGQIWKKGQILGMAKISLLYSWINLHCIFCHKRLLVILQSR